jgi:pyridinium-3,5-biscarboxylic acid mononucleotide synthase
MPFSSRGTIHIERRSTMTGDRIRGLLQGLAEGKMTVDEAFSTLKHVPFEDLDHTKVDFHRGLRRGIHEVIFGQGKTFRQISDIIAAMRAKKVDVLATRIEAEMAKRLLAKFPSAVYNREGRCLYIQQEAVIRGKGPVLVVAAGTSDIPVAEEAYVTSMFLGNVTAKLYDVGVAGIHRVLHHMDLLRSARVIIVVAGMEGALPSIVAGMVEAPVIGVPTSTGYGASFGGLAALLSMLNSCSTVGVFNIDNGFGAAYFATLINRL